MKLEYLETVLAVARLESFSKAAFEIPCAQSSVSRQVKAIEDELGSELFKRSPNSNHVSLTSRGKTLLPMIERLYVSYRELKEAAEKDSGQQSVPIRLGISSYIFSAASKASLSSSLYLVSPEIMLTLEEVPKSQFVQRLDAGQLDAILFYTACWKGEPPPRIDFGDAFQCVPLSTVALTIGMSEEHPLAKQSSISFLDLANECFIFNSDITKTPPNRPFQQHGMFLRSCQAHGFTPRLRMVDRSLADIKQTLAIRGEGVYPSFTPAFLRNTRGICYIPVHDAPYYALYYLLVAEIPQLKRSAMENIEVFLRQSFREEGT